MAGELTPSPVRASAQEPSITEIEARLKEVEELLAAEPAHCWCRYCTKLNVEADALRKGVAALTAAEARGRQQAEQLPRHHPELEAMDPRNVAFRLWQENDKLKAQIQQAEQARDEMHAE